MTQISTLNYIKNALPDLEEDVIFNIYVMICTFLNDNGQNDLDRNNKIEYITNNIVNIEFVHLKTIHRIIRKIVEKNNQKEIMYNVLLEVLNDILNTFENNIGYIDDITSFIDINKKMLITDAAKQAITNKYDIIFRSGYNKTKCNYYNAKRLKNGHLTILKEMTKEFGYLMISKKKLNVVKKFNAVNKVNHDEIFFSIIEMDNDD